MPTKTFLNLNQIKQQKIIESALKEFSNNEYNDVSINKIIINSNIPRGSFYMYFENKDDLFEYIIKMKNEDFNKLVINILKLNQGNIYKTFIDLYDEIKLKVIENNSIYLFKNTFIFLHLKKDKKAIKPFYELYNILKPNININKINEYYLEEAFVLSMQVLFSIIVEYIKTKNNNLKNVYKKRINLIYYGICKEENNVKNI